MAKGGRSAFSRAVGVLRAAFFFGVFALVGGGLFWLMGVRPVLRAMEARSWLEAPAVVTASEVTWQRDRKGRSTYDVTFRYDYTWAGHVYHGSRYGFDGDALGDPRIARRFPAGARTTCWVNPKRPSESVIDREVRWWIALGFFPLLFLGVALGGVVAFVAARRGAR